MTIKCLWQKMTKRFARSCPLVSRGFLEVEVRSGTEAVALLGDSSFKLVITDINMPDGEGGVIVSYLKAVLLPGLVPVIVCSTDRNEHPELADCVEGFAQKPFSRWLTELVGKRSAGWGSPEKISRRSSPPRVYECMSLFG